jgi:hypothetical protein
LSSERSANMPLFSHSVTMSLAQRIAFSHSP